jgi:serine/threonine protein kinase
MHHAELKNHRIQSELGRGGMAIVYLAHDNKFDTKVAVKVLNKEFVHNENIKKRFLAEARSMFRMSHPNVIKVTNLIDEQDTVAFVMEYVEGETLKDFLERKGRLTDVEIKEIFAQMLDAVGYVHEQKLVHRDIKPSNFMLDKSGRVKLMDFGIAKNTDPNAAEYTQTGTGMQMGTPMYMSPEQIKETNSVSAQSDIYSLGVVLWQMVTGKKPYNTNNLSNFELQTKIVTEKLAETQTIWDSIIQKATEKNSLNQYENCVKLKDDLFALRTSNIKDAEFTHIQDEKTELVVQGEIKTKLEDNSVALAANLKNLIYIKLFGPPFFLLITTKIFPIIFSGRIFYDIFKVHAISVLMVVILLSISFIQRMKSIFRKELVHLNMAFFLAFLFFVIGAYFYNLYWHGYFVPYYYFWLVWDFFYVPDVILFYSSLSIFSSLFLIFNLKKDINL